MPHIYIYIFRSFLFKNRGRLEKGKGAEWAKILEIPEF